MARATVFMTYPFPLGQATGGARMSREIARHLAKQGADVTLLPVSATPSTCFPRPAVAREALGTEFDAELARDGVKVVRVPQHRWHWTLDGLPVKRAIRALLAHRRPDIVLSYYHEAAFLPSLLRAHRIPLGFISTWQSYARALGAPLRKVPKLLWPRVNQRLVLTPHRAGAVFFATSHYTKQELIDVVGVEAHRIRVCPLGVAPHFFAIPRAQPERITDFLFFGRVIASKGVADAIEALARLVASGADLRLRIVGQGNHAWARETAQRHGIEGRVEVRDAVDDQGLRAELQRAHVAILPSHFEAFGLCFAEAQAAGLPVVAYDAGSVPEIVVHGTTGWLAPLKDVAALSDCAAAAMRDARATHAAGLAGRARAERSFTWQNTASIILDGSLAAAAAPGLGATEAAR